MSEPSLLRRKSAAIVLIVGFFLTWEVLCVAIPVSDLVLPRPSQVFETLYRRMPVLWPHIMQTLATTLIGFAIGVVIGVLIGSAVGVSRVAYDTAYPLLIGFSSIPKVGRDGGRRPPLQSLR